MPKNASAGEVIEATGDVMDRLQAEVDSFLQRRGLRHDAASHVLDLVSEVGEIAKLVLEATDYGEEPLDVTRDFAGEVGDAAYSLLALGTVLNIDVGQALRAALDKYESRIAATGRPGSGR
jgi:NTP pyrophosphatase (non-canonical NTP hydrolase)